MTSEIIGTAPCLICGQPVTYKKGRTGRITGVCKWQENGCGGQVQTICPPATKKLAEYVARHGKPAEPAQEKPKAAKPDEKTEKARASLGFLDALGGGER